jgi:AraC-like DNA-binding protein
MSLAEESHCANELASYHPFVMALRPICEPVELPLGASVIAEQVKISADTAEVGRFMHFHDVAELVIFRRTTGDFIADGRRFALGDGALTFAPSMRHHDFELGGGPMEWVLIQIDPYLVESIARQSHMARLRRPFCAWPGTEELARIEALADWLSEAARDPSDPAVERIVELLLIAAARAPEGQDSTEDEQSGQVDRLLPVLEQLRSDPARLIRLENAAAMCRMSTAYFSRRFKQVLGMNFSEYARIHRLHLAARRLVTSGAAVSEIAYGLGFSSPSHFSACFFQRFGMTPRDYRHSARRRGS